jgi:hypothetical protein
MSWDFGGDPDTGLGAPEGTGAGGSNWSGSQRDEAPGPVATAPEPSDRPLTPTSAPLIWLASSVVVAVVAILVHFVTDGVWYAMVGWLIGGPVAIGLLGLFVQRDTVRRAQPLYADSWLGDWGRRAVVVLSLAAVALNSWAIADFTARGGWS